MGLGRVRGSACKRLRGFGFRIEGFGVELWQKLRSTEASLLRPHPLESKLSKVYSVGKMSHQLGISVQLLKVSLVLAASVAASSVLGIPS